MVKICQFRFKCFDLIFGFPCIVAFSTVSSLGKYPDSLVPLFAPLRALLHCKQNGSIVTNLGLTLSWPRCPCDTLKITNILCEETIKIYLNKNCFLILESILDIS